ncbi:MAG: urea carboxylase-associated family protein [Rubrivivax sp.]|nr:MAG: urea carboxylase-associated family protein [Rubrivivax sp.]
MTTATSQATTSTPGAVAEQPVHRIPPQSGTAFRLRKGQVLRVIDPQGEQVSDLFAVSADDADCALSSGRSLDYAGRIYLTTGDLLYANNSQVMFTIVSDTVGRHDFLLTPCSQEMFEILYQHQGHHPSCHENLSVPLQAMGVDSHRIGTTFNIFMNVAIDGTTGRITVGTPTSRAGDYIELRAEMDMICGLTACSAEGSNNGSFKPIDYVIL